MALSLASAIRVLYWVSFRPPIQPEWVRWNFFSSFLPVRTASSQLMMMTWSPQSTLGVKVGLFLPRSRTAALAATRPSGLPAASITYHLRSTISAGLASVVLIILIPPYLGGRGPGPGFYAPRRPKPAGLWTRRHTGV